MKSLFITNHTDFQAKINGGVQVCSQEFFNLVGLISENVQTYNVSVSKKLNLRILRKLGLDSYNLYDFSSYEKDLFKVIRDKQTEVIFINKSELIKVAKSLKLQFGNKIKIVLLSHGNESGDFLHEVVKSNYPFYKKITKKIRLGLNLYTESYYRKYVDLVCSLSQEESAIEKWLGAKNTLFVPRVIEANTISWSPITNKVGFVGTLNHKPNLDALYQICEILKNERPYVKFSIVGGPPNEGIALAQKFSFVNYLGALDDKELEKEVSTWSLFLNPVFWYSRGSSMKLAKALSWGIPVITSIAGARGYLFKSKVLNPTPNDPRLFTQQLISYLDTTGEIKQLRKYTVDIDKITYSKQEICDSLITSINSLN